jgi:hypothetical protein
LSPKQIRQDGPNLGPSFTMGLISGSSHVSPLGKFSPKKEKKKAKKKKQTDMILASSIYLVFSFYLSQKHLSTFEVKVKILLQVEQ